MKGMMQRCNCVWRVTPTSHPDLVQAIATRVIANRKSERQSIFDNDGIAADVGLTADATELMNAGIGAYVCAFFNDYMTRKRRRIGHDHVVANQAIVSNVCLGHQKAIIADAGDASSTLRAAVDRYKFANPCAAANFSFSYLTREFKILGRQPNRH